MDAVTRSREMRVEEAWIDYNGHLNMAYYHVLFDRAHDEACDLLGCGRAYLAATGRTIFSAEAHVRYLRELHAGDRVAVDMRLIDHDARRHHWWLELHALDGGFLSATSEVLALHVDLATKKVVPFPEDIMAKAEAWRAAGAALARPEGLGRTIGIRR
jgi:acyl-CoA thioester hydrolase